MVSLEEFINKSNSKSPEAGEDVKSHQNGGLESTAEEAGVEEIFNDEAPGESGEETDEEENVEVQKAVVEELAADKIEQEAEIKNLRQELYIKDGQIKAQQVMMSGRDEEIKKLKTRVLELENALACEKTKEIDQQERNPNALALLDREVELPDRFPGESRDFVIESLRTMRENAEKEGRLRCAQVLEGVLVANEPNGTLAQRRADLEKLFADNGNILSGPVIEELTRLGISHKKGEEYLLPDEIIKRNY